MTRMAKAPRFVTNRKCCPVLLDRQHRQRPIHQAFVWAAVGQAHVLGLALTLLSAAVRTLLSLVQSAPAHLPATFGAGQPSATRRRARPQVESLQERMVLRPCMIGGSLLHAL